MPRRIHIVYRIPSRIAVQMLCPRTVRTAVVRILAGERPRCGVVVPRVHVRQPRRAVADRSRIRHFVVEQACAVFHGRVPVLVVTVTLLECRVGLQKRRYAAADIVVVEVILAREGVR